MGETDRSKTGGMTEKNRKPANKHGFRFFVGDLGQIRTAGLPLRRRSLYPAELRSRMTRSQVPFGSGKSREHPQRHLYIIECTGRFVNGDRLPAISKRAGGISISWCALRLRRRTSSEVSPGRRCRLRTSRSEAENLLQPARFLRRKGRWALRTYSRAREAGSA